MPPPDADPTRTAVPIPDTATFQPDSSDTHPRQHLAPDTRPSPGPFADRSTPFGPPGFDIIAKIGEGGMGAVHQARDLAVGRVVALKVLKLNVFDERAARERFAREVRAMARIEHPNLVPVYQSGEHNGVPFFAMKYMPGGTLAGVRLGGRLGYNRAAELLRDIARGVAAMHAHGILHRDLKPANILLDELGTPHVADFGLVKWTDDDDHTLTGIMNGTPPYMSPEQVAGRSRKLTPACDVWALAVIGFELMSGRRPFDQEDREELYHAITHDPPPDLAEVVPDLPPPLRYVLLAGLNKDPLRRYPTAAQMADDLDRYLASQPVLAAAPETLPLPQPVKRRTFLKVAAGVLGLGAAGGLGVAAFKWLNKPAPPPPLPFGQGVLAALARGETVELIGETGEPKWHAVVPVDSLTVLPAVDSTFTTAPNPSSPKLYTNGWLDLFDTPIPHPYRLEAEVCYRVVGPGSPAFVGLYVGRRLWDAGEVKWQTAAVLLHRLPEPPDAESAGLFFAADPVKEGLTTMPTPLQDGPVAPLPSGALLNRWVKLVVKLRGEDLTGSCDGVTLVPQPAFRGKKLRTKMPTVIASTHPGIKRLPNDTAPPVPNFAAEPSVFGSALGVFVWNASVSVRHARLAPLPPGDPS